MEILELYNNARHDPNSCKEFDDARCEMAFMLTSSFLVGEENVPNLSYLRNDILETSPVINIMLKRIEVLKLPITISTTGMAYLTVCLDVLTPGAGVTVLIDTLNYLERNNKQVTLPFEINADSITKIYPNGFYKDEVLYKIINEGFKTRLIPNSKLY